ncbi:MAG: hypothetical protein K6L76_04385 [Agarilytica sp.]
MVEDIQNTDLVTALLDAQQHHKAVKVYLPNGQQALASAILGFDYYEQTILLDAFNPPLSRHQLQQLGQIPFWLQLRADEHYVNVYCTVLEHKYDLYTLKVLQHEISENQRWFPRISFDARKGPEIELAIPYELPLKGHIKNLSVHGALVEFYGNDAREYMAGLKKCESRVRFNELFEMKLLADVKNYSLQRNPMRTTLRVMFNDHTSVTYSQLENFIDTFNQSSNLFHVANRSAFPQAANFA